MRIKPGTTAYSKKQCPTGKGAYEVDIQIRAFQQNDICTMIGIWNEIVDAGIAFPQEEFLTEKNGSCFFLGVKPTAP